MGAAKRTVNQVGYGEKLAVKIITVDKAKNRVECATNDGAMIWAAVWETGTVFRWPEVGETWTVRKDTNVWRLDQIVQNELTELQSEAVPKTLQELPEGDTRIIGENVHTTNLNSENIDAQGEITAANQSLVSHVDMTPNSVLTYTGDSEEEIWAEESEFLTFDGVTPAKGMRVLLRQQLPGLNGIFEVDDFEISKYIASVLTTENFTNQPVNSTLASGTYGNFIELPEIPAKGYRAELGEWWSPTSYSTKAGLVWGEPIDPGNIGVFTQATVASNTYAGEGGRYISLWTAIPLSLTRSGVRFTMTMGAANQYTLYLQRIVNGAVVNEVNSGGLVTVTAPFTMQLVQRYSGYVALINNAAALILSDTTWVGDTGYTGMEGSGSNPHVINFRTGQAPYAGASAYRSKWRLKRSSDQERLGQTIIVDEGTTRANTEFTIKSVEPTAFETWHSAVLLGSWTNYGTGWAPASYRKLPNGMVLIRGLIKAGAFGPPAPIFTLPVGYRPVENVMWTNHCVYVNGSGVTVVGAVRIDALSSGTVQLEQTAGTSIAYLSITGSFYADGT